MAKSAKVQAKAEAVDNYSKSISTRGGILAVDGTPIPGNSIDVIVLLSVHENKFYEGEFDPDNFAIPDCYAFGDVNNEEDPSEGMAPHPEAPNKQHDNCEECPMNQWGSAAKGRGKACKNVRNLYVMDSSEIEGTPKEIEAAELRRLTLPVTSVKNWGRYAAQVADDMERPSWGVITTISIVPDAKTQFAVVFEFKELINFTQETYDALKKKLAALKKDVIQPYVQFEQTAPVRPQGRAKAAMQRQAVSKPAAKVVGKQAANQGAARGRVGSKF
jgi:hypothetical protein